MLKSLFPWKHHKTKAMAAQQTMDSEVPEIESPNQELLPCHVCGRTFLPAPLKKHERICEKTSTKKRKPFDSLRQRVEGTDLANFHQKSYLKKPEVSSSPDLKRKTHSTWKEKHLALVSAIRAAKGIPDVSNALPKTKSTTALMAGTERCPSCDRQFGPKAYDRHVEWCKEKKAQQRIHHSPANVLLAKERLEARTKYVPPLNRSKKPIIRDKYSNHASTETLISVKSSSPLSRGASVRKPRSVIDMGKNNEKANNNNEDRKEKPRFEKSVSGGGDKARIQENSERCMPVIASPSSRSEISKRGNFNYNPFESAQRQFMELLECDDFKELAPTCAPVKHTQRPHTSVVTPAKQPSPTTTKKTVRSAELTKIAKNVNRASVIEPPSSFKDSLDSITDDFELMENLINDNFTDDNKNNNGFYLHLKSDKESLTLSDILNSRKYSDDMSSIDPMLINENDNLSIPEHFKSDDYSPTSTADTDITIQNDIDCYSVQYDNKIAAFEPKVEEKKLPVKPKTEKKPVVKRSVSLVNRAKTDDSPLKVTNKKLTSKSKLTSNSISSIASTKGVNNDKKKGLSSLKRSMTLFDPSPKPPSLKTKNDVNNYFSEQEQKVSMSVERNTSSPVKELSDLLDETLKPEDLFNVDDEMYEEYKKYEEMYLKEKAQKSVTKKHKPKMVDVNLGIHTASEEEEHSPQFINKISNDSAYGSLTRKTPKHRSRATKLTPLEQKQTDSTSSSGSENCPSSPVPVNQRLSKFCHECGNRYPLTTAKFCVECGVKRLVL